MMRIGIAAVIGGVVLFVWAFISWMFIPWHMMGALPNQEAVRAVLRDGGAESGIYHVPMMDHETYAGLSDEEKGAAEDVFTEQYKEGPVGLLLYKAEGQSPMSVVTLFIGFVLEVLVAAVAAILLSMAAPALPGLGGRIGFVMLLGVFTIVAANLMNWNYMHYPFRFTMEVAADGLVASLLLGVVLAIIIKPYSDMGDVEDASDFEASPEP
ncbi:MAG: hypothetical protein ACYSU7_00180 [Planctomycetota bacterium]|jgi:hypothetical protein